MKKISRDEFQQLQQQGEILERDGHGPKVLRLNAERYLKIFYHRSPWASSRLISRATKFARNARNLQKRSITTVTIIETFAVPAANCDCVIYQGLAGDTVRARLQAGSQLTESQPPADSQNKSFHHRLGVYIAELHRRGVLFRSLHMGNIIVQPDGQLGLIDIADLRLNVFSLNQWQRIRNFQHVFRYQADRQLIDLHAFTEGYLSGVSAKQGSREKLAAAIAQAKPQILAS